MSILRWLGTCGVVLMLAACSSGGDGDLDLGTTSTKVEGLTGSWCGKQVTLAKDCRGDEVMYLSLAEVSGPTTYSGQVCEAFQKDCVGADFGTLTASPAKAVISFGSPAKRRTATLYPSADRATLRMVIDPIVLGKDSYPARDLLLFRVTVDGS